MTLGWHFQTRTILLLSSAFTILLMIPMLTTTPDKLGPFGITLWFSGLLFALGGWFTLGLYGISRLIHPERALEHLSENLRHGILIGTWITALVALHSLHQLGLKDIILISVLVAAVEFYFRRVMPTRLL